MQKVLKVGLILVVAMVLGVYALNSMVNGTDDPTPAEMMEGLQEVYDEAYLKGNVDALDEVYGPDFPGLDAIKEGIKRSRLTFSECRAIFNELFVSGDRIITQWTFQGTYAGDANSKWIFQNKGTGESETIGVSIPAGAKYTSKGCTIVRVVNNRAVKAWSYTDSIVPQLTAAGIELKTEPIKE